MAFLRVLRQEVRLQLRTLRFRFGVLLCLLPAIALPFVLLWLLQPHTSWRMGPNSYYSVMLDALRFSTVLLAFVVAGNRADLEAGRQMWPVLAGARIGNAGYLVRRVLSQIIIVWVATLIPFLTTTLIHLPTAGLSPSDPWRVLGSWLIHIAPTAAIFVALWSSVVRITGTELGCLMALFFGQSVFRAVLEKGLQPLVGTRLMLHTDWFGYDTFMNLPRHLFWLNRENRRWVSQRFLVSDAPFSPHKAWEEWLPQAALNVGFTCLCFAGSIYFVRRTIRNLAPLQLSEDHQLRTFMRYFHIFRLRYAGDGALRGGRVGLLIGGLAFILSIVVIDHRQGAFRDLAARRYAAEMSTDDLPVLSSLTRAVDWHLKGHISEHDLRVESSGRLRHDGDQPMTLLPFQLNPFVEVELEIPGRQARVERRWDRLLVTVDPPIQPGQEVQLKAIVSGAPATPEFELAAFQEVDSFASRYEALRDGADIARGSDLGLSHLGRGLDRRRVVLPASSLTPVLRYGTWELTPRPVAEQEKGLEVPEPTAFPTVDLHVDLQSVEGRFLADSCGDATIGDGRLELGCRIALSEYRIQGGIFNQATSSAGLVLAARPGHEELMAKHLPALESVIALSAEAWPGLPPLERLVVLEDFEFDVHGRLLRLPEMTVIRDRPLKVERYVGALMGPELLTRREVRADQSWIFPHFFGAIMSRRMGLGRDGGATLSGRAFEEFKASRAVLLMEEYDAYVLEVKVPALVAYMESLVGGDNFVRAVEEFLSRQEAAPGSMEELIEDLERHGQVSLQDIYEDYLIGAQLPKLALEEVRSEPDQLGRWRVTGKLVNRGSGRVRCPLVVRAEGQELTLNVSVGKGGSEAWEAVMDYEPHTVQLDPGLTCLRWVTRGRLQVERISVEAS